MTVKSTCAVTALALAFPIAGFAQGSTSDDLSYTYLELDYVNLDIDVADDDEDLLEDFDDGNGWGAKASFAFTPNFFGFLTYSDTESDVSFTGPDNFPVPADTNVKRFDVGLGFNTPVSIGSLNTDFVAQAAYVDVDYGDFDFGASGDESLDDLTEDSSDGWAAEAKFRSQLTTWLEASLGAGYLDVEDADGFSVVGNLLFELNPNLGINVDANVGDDVSTYGLGIRYSFDRF